MTRCGRWHNMGITALREVPMDAACEAALTHGAYRLRIIRTHLKKKESQQQRQFDVLDEHPMIRRLNHMRQNSEFLCDVRTGKMAEG